MPTDLRRPAVVTHRPVRDEDTPLLRTLFEEARPELSLLTPDVRAGILDLQLRAQRLQQEADHPGRRREIVQTDGAAVGVVVTDRDATTIHLLELALLAQERGRGVGSVVLGNLLVEARASGRAVTLQVWAHNTGARRLYERLGFGYVAPSTDTGHLRMRWPHQEA